MDTSDDDEKESIYKFAIHLRGLIISLISVHDT